MAYLSMRPPKQSNRYKPGAAMKIRSSFMYPFFMVMSLSSQAQTLCPDGSYVGGDSCSLAPDGTYVDDEPRLAPDGSYVGGEPRLAPDGTYVGDEPELAPDGSYVGGEPILAPDGSYVGGDSESD